MTNKIRSNHINIRCWTTLWEIQGWFETSRIFWLFNLLSHLKDVYWCDNYKLNMVKNDHKKMRYEKKMMITTVILHNDPSFWNHMIILNFKKFYFNLTSSIVSMVYIMIMKKILKIVKLKLKNKICHEQNYLQSHCHLPQKTFKT